jgi:DNA-binding transcriptional MerR regulator
MSYSIDEVAKRFHLSPYTIRFYDKEGLLPFISRNKSGNREFTESDLNLFRLICCLKNTGMQIKDIKVYIDLVMRGTDTIELRKKILREHREKIIKQMDAFRESLDLVDSKIEIYESNDAVKIINEQVERAFEEKRKRGLL